MIQGKRSAWGLGWLIAALLNALLPGLATQVQARPFTVDDLLKTESFAQVLIDPRERWLVIEKRDPWESAPAFDYETHIEYGLGRLLIVDLHKPAPARPLIPKDPATGIVALGFSPQGSHLAVARLHQRRWELGIAALPSGRTRWLGLTPSLAVAGRALQWRSETELIALVHEGDELPMEVRAGWQASERLPRWWAATARGTAVAATAIGSGRYRALLRRMRNRRCWR